MKIAPHLFAILMLFTLSLAGCATPADVRHDSTKPVRNDGGGY